MREESIPAIVPSSFLKRYENSTAEERASFSLVELEAALRVELLRQQSGVLDSPLRQYPNVARALPPATVAAIWRELNFVVALLNFKDLPASAQEEITPEEMASLWTREVDKSGHRALWYLCEIPKRWRELIRPEAIRTAWTGLSQTEMQVAMRLPKEAVDAIGQEEVEQACFEIGRLWGSYALKLQLGVIERDLVVIEESGLSKIWEGYASIFPEAALKWFREQRAIIRNHISLDGVHEAWRKVLAADPIGALDWRDRVPKKLRPGLTGVLLQPLLLNSDHQIRLRALALLSEVRDQGGEHYEPARNAAARSMG